MKNLFLVALALTSALPVIAQNDSGAAGEQMVAVIFYWKAKPGKVNDYNRYIQDVAEPIDRDAQKHGAFISVATFVSQNPDSAWTHMRWFTLKNRTQAEALKAELDAATARVVPEVSKRKANSEYAATLRDAVGSEEVLILSPKHAPKCDCQYESPSSSPRP